MCDAAATRGRGTSEAMEIGNELDNANGDLPGVPDTPRWERTNPASSDFTLSAMDTVPAHSGHPCGGTAPLDSSPSPTMAGTSQEQDVRRSTVSDCYNPILTVQLNLNLQTKHTRNPLLYFCLMCCYFKNSQYQGSTARAHVQIDVYEQYCLLTIL